jgi:hypothetical protein
VENTQTHAGFAPHARGALRLERTLLAAPCLLLAALTLPFAYHFTLSEPDLARMMAALVYGHATGLQDAAGMHYGARFSFGYYQLLYAVAPSDWLQSPDLAGRLINAMGIVAGLACAAACTLYLRSLFELRAAAAASMIFLLSPMMLPLALSGHPLVGAAASLFFAGWLLVQAQPHQGTPYVWRVVAAALLLLGALTLRAEVILAFPFLLFAARAPAPDAHAPWFLYATRAIALIGAFAAFLFLQRGYVAESGGAAASLLGFMQAFMSSGRTVHGLAVLGLGAGLMTLAAVLWTVWRNGASARELWLPLALGLPALVFWLPNPQPARHFFFPVLALALIVGLCLARSPLGRSRHWLLAVLLIVLGNQVAGELVRPLVVAGYGWSYAPVGERRTTQQVPLGFFPLDQRANQAHAELQRREAIALARHAPARLVVLADAQHYLIAHLIASTEAMEWREARWKGIDIVELRSPARTVVLVNKHGAWPRDVTAEVLQEPRWRDWPLYVQPFTLSRYDRTAVPPERRLVLN